MDIIGLDNLVIQGVSLAEVQQSLSINCFDTTFKRKSDLPKKFKTKALNLSAEIVKTGIKSFVTETNYSYTVWEEEKIEKTDLSSILDDQIMQESESESSLSSDELNKIDYTYQYNQPSSENIIKDFNYKSTPMTINETIPLNRETSSSTAQQIGITNVDELKVTEEVNQKNTTIKKTRTYRGIVYEL